MTKATKCCPNKLLLIPNYAMEFLCSWEVTSHYFHKRPLFLFCHFSNIMFVLHYCTKLWPLHLRGLESSTVKMKCLEKLRCNKIMSLSLQTSHPHLLVTVNLGFNVSAYVCITEFQSVFRLENSLQRGMRKVCASSPLPNLVLFKVNP